MKNEDIRSDTGVSDDRLKELTERLGEQLTSRRTFLSKSATVGGGALALGLGSGAAAAHGDNSSVDDNGKHNGDDNNGDHHDRDVSAVEVLNYALTLEYLEATFYEQGLEMFDDDDFQNGAFADNLDGHQRSHIRDYFVIIHDHEQAHVDVIRKTIRKLGGEPVSGLEFEFPYDNVDEFVALAMVLENTGVYAYDGAINLLENDKLLTAAATIATVEGRHASYLNLLNDEVPFPMAFDRTLSMEEVKEKVAPFIVSN